MADYEKMTGDKKISEIEDLVEIDGGEKVLVAYNGQNYVISVDRLINEGHLHSYQDLEDLQALMNIIDAQYQHIKDSTLPTTSKEISGSIKEIYEDLLEIVNKVDFVTPEMFGAKGDGVTDDTQAFQNAIDFCSRAEGSKKIQLLAKTYVIGTLNLKRYTRIEGYGWKSSFLKVVPGLNTQLLTIKEKNANLITLKDFCILGDRENNTCPAGIYFAKAEAIGELDENWKSADAWLVVENIRITNLYGNGVQTVNGARECRFTNLNISNCGGWGMHVKGSDSNYQFISCWANDGGGISINGSADRFINCKCFANGNASNPANGFYVTHTTGITMVACEAQENFGHGFFLDRTKDSSFIGLRADCNGLIDRGLEELHYSGIYLNDEVQTIVMSAVCSDFRRLNGSGAAQKYGISLGGLMYSNIDIIVKANEELYHAPMPFVLTNAGSNTISVNGRVITKQRVPDIEIKSGDDGNAILSLGAITEKKYYQFLNNADGGFQIDVYENGQWVRVPFRITAGNAVTLGAKDSIVGFFGEWGSTKLTSQPNASDLATAITLVNDLKYILKTYGLIN